MLAYHMADPTFSPDGKWMWNGSEWIPSPPTEETNSVEQPDYEQNNIVSVAKQSIRNDQNFYYKSTGLFLLLLSLFFPYLGPESPFSIQFLGADPISKSFEPSSLNYTDSYFALFTMILAVLLPYAVLVLSIFVLVKIRRSKNLQQIGYILVMLCLTLLLFVTITYPMANYDLDDIGAGCIISLLSGVLFSIKGGFLILNDGSEIES